MQLKMVVGTTVIDSVPVDHGKLLEEGYLQGLKIYLQERNMDVFNNTRPDDISYFVEEVPSKMNQWINK